MKSNQQRGFTLLEMVIVLGIVGALIGTFLSFYQPTVNARAKAETDLKIQRVLNAVSNYAMRNSRLPCAATPTVDPATGNFGNESACAAGANSQGLIPFRTLGLMQEDAQDGFGRYMTYLVHGPATVARGTGGDLLVSALPLETGSFFCNVNTGMTIRRTTNLVTTNEVTNAVVAIVAYGPDGDGAYNMTLADISQRGNPINVAALNTVTGTRELQNAVDQSADQTDINDYSLVTNPITNHFDDQVAYMTSAALVTRLGVTVCHVRLF